MSSDIEHETLATLSESERLEQISRDSAYSAGVMSASIAYCFDVIRRELATGPILELGPAEGLMTDMLVETGNPVTVVEGSSRFCQSIKARHPDVNVVNALFEEFETQERFSTIVLGHVLEHVVDPVALLRQVAGWLALGGVIFAAVPNALSLHRQAAVLMELLATEDSLNASDVEHGHRRVFGPDDFREVFVKADLETRRFGGYWLKPLSNAQIEANWTPAMVSAFMRLGERYPEIAGEIYVVAGASQA